MTTHMTKTWFDGKNIITQKIPEAEIYKREWVGLTFAEICDAEVVAPDEFNYFSELKFARAIEAKL